MPTASRRARYQARATPLLVPGRLPPRRVAEALFPDADIRYVDRYDAIADVFDRLDDQRPATCGAYATLYLLTHSASRSDGTSTLREAYLALLVGTLVEPFEVEPSERVRAEVAAAGLSDEEALRRFPRTYYRWPLGSSKDESLLGTSPTGTTGGRDRLWRCARDLAGAGATPAGARS